MSSLYDCSASLPVSLSPKAGAVLWMELVSRVATCTTPYWQVSDVLKNLRDGVVQALVPRITRLSDIGNVKARMIFQRNNSARYPTRPLSEPFLRRASSLRYEMTPEDVDSSSSESWSSDSSRFSRSSIQSSTCLDVNTNEEAAKEIEFYRDKEPVFEEDFHSPVLSCYLGIDNSPQQPLSRASQLLETLLEAHKAHRRLPSEKISTRDISWPLETMYSSLVDPGFTLSSDRISKSIVGACNRAKARKASSNVSPKYTEKIITFKKVKQCLAELRRYILHPTNH